MAYIIINGVSSKNINGLLIQNLPPISKPKIRTSAEEIDGRDGDVVTTLGYAAYDKTFSIGLRGDYNVDDVISFFNTSGRVIFSNEADKYYNFAIFNQIDFDKLIRFKTATVSMHVQPFKYSVDETELVFNNPSDDTTAELKIRNNGNIYSKPTITITGAGIINVYVDTVQVLSINLSNAGETIIINVADMNAYDESGNYLNRKVTGDYDDLRLQAGITNLRITGAYETIKINNYSRWI